jgi:hypothetical protein
MMVYGCTHDAPESNDEHLFVEVGNKLLCNNSALQLALDVHGTHFDVVRNDGGADGDKQIRLRHGYCEHIRFTHSLCSKTFTGTRHEYPHLHAVEHSSHSLRCELQASQTQGVQEKAVVHAKGIKYVKYVT